MKPSGKRHIPQSQPQQPAPQDFLPSSPCVRRHVHPIRTIPSPGHGNTEQVLRGIASSLARQTELLEELLRRTESDNSDTM